MTAVLLIVHLMIAAAMVGVVLLQRSEGGALGIGGGGGGFMTGRGAANLLTRVTAGLAAAFFVTSLTLSLIASRPEKQPSLFEPTTTSEPAKKTPDAAKEPGTKAPETKAPEPAAKGGGILDKLEAPQGGKGSSRLPQSK